MTTRPMPLIDPTKFSDSEIRKFAEAISTTRKGENRLRASKPECDNGEASYVWRMVAFEVSPKSQHHCIPVTADFGMSLNYEERRTRCNELDVVVDAIVNSIPKNEWHGISRWRRGFGMV